MTEGQLAVVLIAFLFCLPPIFAENRTIIYLSRPVIFLWIFGRFDVMDCCRCLSGVDTIRRHTEDMWWWHGCRVRDWQWQRPFGQLPSPSSSSRAPASAAVVVVVDCTATQEEAPSSVQQGADVRTGATIPTTALRVGRWTGAPRQLTSTDADTGRHLHFDAAPAN